MAGKNRAIQSSVYDSVSFESASTRIKRPCIFLSHISIDKDTVREIANYLMKFGDVDIYLDENDSELQDAALMGNPHKVTELIEKGVASSSHIMCLVSKETSKSWWVPYEIGYAKKSGKEISSLKIKGEVELPEFLKIGEILKGTKSLNEYLKSLRTVISMESADTHIFDNNIPVYNKEHPLDDYLDWKL